MGKIGLAIKLLSNLAMVGKLLAIVKRNRFYTDRVVLEQFDGRRFDGLRRGAGQVGHFQEAALPLDQRQNGPLPLGTDHRVSFPMSRLGAGFDLGGPVFDAHPEERLPVGYAPPALGAVAAFAALFVRLPQVLVKRSPSPFVGVDELVNRLMTQAGLVFFLQPTGNLLGAVLLTKPVHNGLQTFAFGLVRCSLPPFYGLFVGRLRRVALRGAVALEFPADGRLANGYLFRDGRWTQALLTQAGDGVSLGQAKVSHDFWRVVPQNYGLCFCPGKRAVGSLSAF